MTQRPERLLEDLVREAQENGQYSAGDLMTDEGVVFASGGERKNKGKIRFDLIPPEADLAMALVLTKGVAKYDARNWEKGMPMVEGMVASLKRHLNAWEFGEDYDRESNLLHMAHVLTNAAFLVALQMRPAPDRFDDRPHKIHIGAVEEQRPMEPQPVVTPTVICSDEFCTGRCMDA